jgi:protein SCO1
MRKFGFLLSISCILASCSAPQQGGITVDSVVQNNGEGEVGGLQRIMKYYPLDSVDAKGQKVYHTIRNVQLTDQNGQVFQTAIRGKISIVNFFFATCTGTCPRINKELIRVQEAFKNNPEVVLVSYTVDPEEDSIPALLAYSKSYKAIPGKWFFLTGNKKDIYDMARYDYFLPVEPGNGDSEDFIHSDQVTICDKQGIVRGYYTGTDALMVDSMITDVKLLQQEK